ncbi:MAG: amylo-alpha-1,6-glucosidase [Ignavibacteria bacterium]|nr:amylo-alpha-1,6-glucosidase [Ignavibacteria bacterium]
MKNVAFLVADPHSVSPEEESAWSFLSRQKAFRGRRISFLAIAQKPHILREYDILWWHFDSSTTIPPEALEPNVIENLREHVRRGRGLLLSLLASQYIVDLGLDTVRPNICASGTWTESSWAAGYPDIRGFAGFKRHPIFEGFAGGLYTWAPRVGDHFSAAYHEEGTPLSGKIVAVEKLYIKLNEHRRNIVEHRHGKGVVLSIGSHFYFLDQKQRYRAHLEKFTLSCLDYLQMRHTHRSERRPSEKDPGESYWHFGVPTVTEFTHRSNPLRAIDRKLSNASGELVLHRDFTAPGRQEQFFDLSGRRILMMGKERSGIAEVWCHSVRILEDLKVGFKVGDAQPRWSQELNAVVTITPGSLTRRFEIDDCVIEETTFADSTRPCGALHYRVRTKERVQIILTARVDLRLMWPVSEHATGSLRYAWDDGICAGILTDRNSGVASLLGSSLKPTAWTIGQYSEVVIEDDHLTGRRTERAVAAIGLRVTLTPKNRQCTFAVAGSDQSLREAVHSYRSIMRHPASSLSRQVRRFRDLERKSTRVVTPDEQFNKAYRWSLVGLEKLFVETPRLGRSFVAGYGLSTSGWHGDHEVSGRPGYAWYFGRDSVWTSLAVLDYGDHEKVREVLEFLGKHQDTSGKILHEMTTSGYAHYDAADSTPLYLVLMGRYVRITGDRKFAKEQFDRVRKAIQYCFSTDTDGDHLIENTNVGHGWVEGGQLFPVHTEHYLASCWAEALAESSTVAELAGEAMLARKWRRESKVVRNIVKRDFWNPQTGFYNFAKHQDGHFHEEQTVLPAVGMYFGCSEEKNLSVSLDEYASDNFSSDWGVRIVGKNNSLFNPAGYHNGSIWPLFTGWTALAEFSHQRPLQGYLHLLSNLLLYDQFCGGCIEEVLHGDRFQAAGVCPHQAWSQSMVLQPVLEGMIGLKADALKRTLDLSPYFPPHWKKAEVRNIRVGDQRFGLNMRRTENETCYTIFPETRFAGAKHRNNVSLRFKPIFPLGTEIIDIRIGSRMDRARVFVGEYTSLPIIRARLNRKLAIRIRHTGGMAVIPPVPHLRLGEGSSGIRIINESWRVRSYTLIVEGKVGQEYLLDVLDHSLAVAIVEGAAVLARDGNHLILAVTFPGNGSKAEYVRKEIRLST